MVFLADRRRREDRFLEWKVRIFSVSAALVLAGLYFESRWMTGAALVLLLGAMALRFLPGGGSVRGGWREDGGSEGDADGENDEGVDEDGAPV